MDTKIDLVKKASWMVIKKKSSEMVYFALDEQDSCQALHQAPDVSLGWSSVKEVKGANP